PLAMSAGYTTLNILNSNADFYTQLETRAAQLEQGIQKNIKDLGIPAVFNRIGSMFTLFFTTEKQVESYADVRTSNTEQYAKFFKASLDAGIYFAPSQFEAGFVSAAHTEQDIEITITKNREALSQLL
ncbi:MAG: aspartate aminotransferase family protein, partial [Bacteroidales bacterium]|nr:aspartate aminotransferase family protein [Bacteroidales bacterium]